MISYERSQNLNSGGSEVCTTASIFEKQNSLKLEILFGNHFKRAPLKSNDHTLINAFEYWFYPNDIFGFAYESTGIDYQKFNHAFVLRACAPEEKGHSIFGISPGAEILVFALKNATASRLKSTLKTLQENGLDLSKIPIAKYQHLNRVLDANSNLKYFVGELIGSQI